MIDRYMYFVCVIGKGSHNGKATGANIKIHSKGNLQVGARPVLVKSSGTSVPNITTGKASHVTIETYT